MGSVYISFRRFSLDCVSTADLMIVQRSESKQYIFGQLREGLLLAMILSSLASYQLQSETFLFKPLKAFPTINKPGH